MEVTLTLTKHPAPRTFFAITFPIRNWQVKLWCGACFEDILVHCNFVFHSELSKHHPRVQIRYVTVAWFLGSIKAGSRLNEANFTPEGMKTGQAKLTFGTSGKVDSNRALTSSSSVVMSPDMHTRLPSNDRMLPPAASAGSPGYMKQFFKASRLHFIGTWRSRLPALIAELEQEWGDGQKREYGIDRFAIEDSCDAGAKTATGGCIIHLDMDCFFVSVLTRTRPDLNSKPVAVAHSSTAGHSEVSSCNYAARAQGR